MNRIETTENPEYVTEIMRTIYENRIQSFKYLTFFFYSHLALHTHTHILTRYHFCDLCGNRIFVSCCFASFETVYNVHLFQTKDE